MRIALLLALVIAPTSCRAAVPAGAQVRLVGGAEARVLVDGGARVLDVRTPEEFAAGHVAGAVNVPFEQIAARVPEIGDPSRPVVVYCRSGRRSGLAARSLLESGFTQVYDMRSVSAWPGPLVSVAAALRGRYASDHAHGYAAGDLRGLFWVEMDAAGARP